MVVGLVVVCGFFTSPAVRVGVVIVVVVVVVFVFLNQGDGQGTLWKKYMYDDTEGRNDTETTTETGNEY